MCSSYHHHKVLERGGKNVGLKSRVSRFPNLTSGGITAEVASSVTVSRRGGCKGGQMTRKMMSDALAPQGRLQYSAPAGSGITRFHEPVNTSVRGWDGDTGE
ncbi:hypothetical protein Hypma_008306 [Hypsizygus marmoreus]|uniref:Uncharacterized protein n=1 Tax=Hypsizygus marmoreus TaxID=39966 RepID=A0A369JY24_HYPMA|nr:hypothetical protein Hypma_008306 [Hypsizygus marmoreus]